MTLVNTDPAALATGLERARAIAVRRVAKDRATDDEPRAIGPRFSRGERLAGRVDSGRLRAGWEVRPVAWAADRGIPEPDGAQSS